MEIKYRKSVKNMIVVGLTGPSGAGKGEVCAAFSQLGVPSLDTDRVYAALIKKGKTCAEELIAHFGETISGEDGVNKKKLAEIVFSDGEKLAELNRIAHRHILGYCREWLAEREREGNRIAVVDAPLLFESGFDSECDLVVTVVSGEPGRIERIRKRDRISPEAIRARLKNQKNNEFYTSRADYVIQNETGLTELRRQVTELYIKLTGKETEK